jgi:hypothetical protein
MRGHFIALHIDLIGMPEAIFSEMFSFCIVRFLPLFFKPHCIKFTHYDALLNIF